MGRGSRRRGDSNGTGFERFGAGIVELWAVEVWDAKRAKSHAKSHPPTILKTAISSVWIGDHRLHGQTSLLLTLTFTLTGLAIEISSVDLLGSPLVLPLRQPIGL
jgi:hypothetical protein